MRNKLFIIGNGFDLAHNLPTRFNPDFMKLAKQFEQDNFWDLYQTREQDIWSDFENLLGYPDFNNLEIIFNGYEPDYLSDKESDRCCIMYQVDLNGRLRDALDAFASNAEKCLNNIQRKTFFKEILDSDAHYINFNYTHTLEKIYHISPEQVLHIHGEVGENNLKLGYPKGNFKPEKYYHDIRGKGTGSYDGIEMEDFINRIEDYYVKTAYEMLLSKCKSFYKEIELDILKEFLEENGCAIEEVVVYGHSCAIDFEYFEYLNTRYPNASWKFYTKGRKSENNIKSMMNMFNIMNYSIEM